jgi:hypothetical protein
VIAGTYNIICDQGSSFTRTFVIEYQDAIDETVFHPYDLSGYTARMQIRKDVYATAVLATLTTENGSIDIDELAGTVTISMTAIQTAAIERSGVYDIELISLGQGIVNKPIRGDFELRLEVTR